MEDEQKESFMPGGKTFIKIHSQKKQPLSRKIMKWENMLVPKGMHDYRRVLYKMHDSTRGHGILKKRRGKVDLLCGVELFKCELRHRIMK